METCVLLMFVLAIGAFMEAIMETEVWFERTLLLVASVILAFPGLYVTFKWALT